MKRVFSAAALAAVFLGLPSLANAQDDSALARSDLFVRDRNVSVRQRPKPEYSESPIHLGAFLFTPTITAGVEGNDNVFATESNTRSDVIFRVQPSALLQTNWSRNFASVYARASVNQYVENTGENTVDYQIGTADRVDIARDLGVSFGGSYERDTEPRTSSGSPADVAHPIRYTLGAVYGQATKEFNRLRLTGRFDFRDFDYDNGATTSGVRVYEDDRDHSIASGGGKLEYAISPSTSVFFNAVVNNRSFRNQLPGEAARNSNGFEITAGSNFDLTHLIRGEVYVGYLEQSYRSSGYGTISGISARGLVEYFLTPLTTITATGSRSVEDAGIFNVGGYLSSNVTLQIDHELLRNVILNATAGYGEDDYHDISRTDERKSIAIGATYLLNRAVGANLTYTHYTQDSSGRAAGPSFDTNRILASLVYQF